MPKVSQFQPYHNAQVLVSLTIFYWLGHWYWTRWRWDAFYLWLPLTINGSFKEGAWTGETAVFTWMVLRKTKSTCLNNTWAVFSSKYDQILEKHFPWEIPSAWFVSLCPVILSPWCKIIALLGHGCCRKFNFSCQRNSDASQHVWMSKPNQHDSMFIFLVYHIPTTWVMEEDYKNDSKRTDVRNIWRTLCSCQANMLYF